MQDVFLRYTIQAAARQPGFADLILAIPPHHPAALNPLARPSPGTASYGVAKRARG